MRTEPSDDASTALNPSIQATSESDARSLTCRLRNIFSWETWEVISDLVGSALRGVASWWTDGPQDPRTQRLSLSQQGPPPPSGSTGNVVMVGNICVSPRPRQSVSHDATAVSSTSAVVASTPAPG